MLTRAARERAGRRFPSRLPPDLVLQFLEPRDLVLQACVSVGWRDAADLVFRQVEARELATSAFKGQGCDAIVGAASSGPSALAALALKESSTPQARLGPLLLPACS